MKSALELFDGEADRKQTALNDIYLPAVCALTGFTSAIFMNWATRRPVFSGIQRHFLYGGIGGIFGKAADGWRNNYLAERDAALRHYITLHPEDFQLPARQKFADVLLPWVPIR